MGGSYYSSDDYNVRSSLRSSTAKSLGISVDDATFAYSKTASKVHDSLNPNGIKVRESRDSDAHPVSVPIGITLDCTGSMSRVPFELQKDLCGLMGTFLEDKASGKKYLGDGYPAILISAIDDLRRGTGVNGCLQVGQFESGLEIDDNLTNLWITGNGGGGPVKESYILAALFAARFTVHDHLEKRGAKGYWFFIGDEMTDDDVTAQEIKEVFGAAGEKVTLEEVMKDMQEKYHVFFILPNNTSHYNNPMITDFWNRYLPQGHVLKLPELKDLCKTIAGCVAMYEGDVDLDTLMADGVAADGALAPLSVLSRTAVAGAVSRKNQFNAGSLPAVSGDAGSTERL